MFDAGENVVSEQENEAEKSLSQVARRVLRTAYHVERRARVFRRSDRVIQHCWRHVYSCELQDHIMTKITLTVAWHLTPSPS